MSIAENIKRYQSSLPSGVKLIAVSKTKPVEDLQQAYEAGQRLFGENKALEMRDKHEVLPKDIHWHFIGHLQTNKVKYIVPFVSMIHSVDSLKVQQGGRLSFASRYCPRRNQVWNERGRVGGTS